jgi:superfamily II DNA or RNA helicase
MPKAQHPKAASFVRQNLFAGLASFAELEERIAALPDEPSRGAAFEVFAEAFLATQRKHDAAAVWPLASVPTQTLQTLGLATQDYGVDGVFQTLLGHFSAYQVKFRTGRPALTWRELSTFLGLADSPHIRSRVLLTNCDDLPPVLNERQGFFCIRGSDLDRLVADDFRAIEAWLADAAFIAPKKQPQPHQIEGLEALLPALETHDRVSAIMACGTGKTLLALWIAEHVARASSPAGSGGVPAARILVLVPSLALLRQTLHEWLRETSLPSLAYLCVCSDPTVKEGLDSIATAQSELDFQVSTDAASVRDFLDAPFTGTKIVFCTYQSAPVVGAALKPGEAFDLGVFDEAHKTAGREGRNYAFALEDANLPIRKRLFLTATPRHYNPLCKDKEGDAQLVFSMDNPAVYGPQAYRLTFAEAARRGIICGYKVIISVITSEMVTNELLSRGEVIVNGDAVRARQVANQIALRDAIEKYGVSKVFTFHKTVASAASFVAASSEGVCAHLPHFQTFHVNGTMPTAHREREMRDFRAAAHAVMSNARCLTEGVDVPAVDMVAFLSPRRSLVDIVQATGRAMRKSPGKAAGYVLVPLYVEQAAGETIEEAVSRAEFAEIWDVLQSLQEQDVVLSESIRDMSERRGLGKEFDEHRFADRIDFGGPRLRLETLREVVAAYCLENLYSSWDTYFGKLKAFKERFGHCNVETGWKEDRSLWSWVSTQRHRRKQGAAFPEQIRLLDELGFIWDWQSLKADQNWMESYRKLEAYKAEHGNCRVQMKHKWLGRWVNKNRGDFAEGTLSPERIARLNEIGFEWRLRAKEIDRLAQLRAFKTEYGHCRVTSKHKSYPGLAGWCSLQRNIFNKGKLHPHRVAQLAALDFWSDDSSRARLAGSNRFVAVSWSVRFAQLQEFKEKHGNCRVPVDSKVNPQLGRWVGRQRELYNKGQIKADRIAKLEALGFEWALKPKVDN